MARLQQYMSKEEIIGVTLWRPLVKQDCEQNLGLNWIVQWTDIGLNYDPCTLVKLKLHKNVRFFTLRSASRQKFSDYRKLM